jgi:hypothetical protein
MLIYALANGGTCGIVSSNLLIACKTDPGVGYAMGGTTYGNTCISSMSAKEVAKNKGLLEHESTHSTQWAIFGLLFAGLYPLSRLEASANMREGNNADCNVFEHWAGYKGGNYTYCPNY